MSRRSTVQDADALDLQAILATTERYVDVGTVNGLTVVRDFVSRSASAPPCFPCVSYTVQKPDAIIDGSYFIRLAWVVPSPAKVGQG